MSLTVHLPPNVSRSQDTTLQLPPFDEDVEAEALSVQDPSLLQSNDRFHVFSGSLVSSDPESRPTRVVCKLSYDSAGMDRLMGEDMIYDDLKNLQGKVVPRCHGYFEDPQVAGCLVLDYAGEALQYSFASQDDELK